MDEQPPPADVVPVDDVGSLVLPLDQYIFARPGETDLILRAEWILVAKCVQRFGLEWTPPVPLNSPENISAKYFSLYSEEDARRIGYHSDWEPPPEPTPGDELPKLQIVKFGRGPKRFAGLEVPKGGCYGEARRYLAQGLPVVENEQFGLQLKNDASSDAERDPRVQEAFRRWSSCMEKAGYHYSTPWDAWNDPRWRGEIASPLEIATAIADMEGKKATGLLDIWVAVTRAYEQRYVDRHAAALAELTTAMKALEKRAIEIINRG